MVSFIQFGGDRLVQRLSKRWRKVLAADAKLRLPGLSVPVPEKFAMG